MGKTAVTDKAPNKAKKQKRKDTQQRKEDSKETADNEKSKKRPKEHKAVDTGRGEASIVNGQTQSEERGGDGATKAALSKGKSEPDRGKKRRGKKASLAEDATSTAVSSSAGLVPVLQAAAINDDTADDILGSFLTQFLGSCDQDSAKTPQSRQLSPTATSSRAPASMSDLKDNGSEATASSTRPQARRTNSV